ncbi:MAG: type II secretion system GspH family protein [Candidatus Gastranaerophilales bacterium]|nr:type II secretion system GspH family protein [Candidatus Gastranaerophilales bacterium]
MKKGFTLAEVIITLAIIGIVAAITIPTVISQQEKQAAVAQLKVAYSIVSQIVNKNWEENSSIADWDLNLDETTLGRTYVRPYVTYTRECTKMEDGCFETDGFYGYYDLRGDKITTSVPYSLILNNGMILGVNLVSYGKARLVSFIVDINGHKKPNKMGRDIFSFYIYNSNISFCQDAERYEDKDGLYIGGYDNCGPPHVFYTREELLGTGVLRSCSKKGYNGGGTRPGVGTACAAVIMQDGWQIKKDYPW